MNNSPARDDTKLSFQAAPIPFIGAEILKGILTANQAIDSLVTVLKSGFDPAGDPARSSVSLSDGELLIMPSRTPDFIGTKLLTIASHALPDVPRVQGLYALFDGRSLSPVAILDGVALTSLRTPAVSLAVALPALELDASPLEVVVFGVGPQGIGHIELLLASIRGRAVRNVTYVTRSEGVRVIEHKGISTSVFVNGDPRIEEPLRLAGLVICATTSSTPLFDSRLVADNVIVVAVGSHEPLKRELEGGLLERSTVVVEDVKTALREAGDIILAIAESNLAADRLIPMSTLFKTEPELNRSRPLVFKTTGMAWEDLTLASAIYSAWSSTSS
jgi:ornithine cyclodeaminase